MSDIIQSLSAQLGISPDTAVTGAGAVMNLLKEKAPAGDFQQLLGKVPEAGDWMSKAPEPEASGGGGLLGAASGLLGGGGGLTAVVGMLSKSGLDASTASKFLPLLLQLLQARAGDDVMGKLAGSAPFLKEAMGGGGLGGMLGGLLGRK